MKKTIIILLSLLSIFSLSSCTKVVWEDREECPCILTLDLSGIPVSVKNLRVWIFTSSGELINTATFSSEILDHDLSISRNQNIKYFVWGNTTNVVDNGNLSMLMGHPDMEIPFDSLYFFSNTINTKSIESLRDTISLKKEHITLTLKLVEMDEPVSAVDLLVHTKGKYVDGGAVLGERTFSAVSKTQNTYYFVIPRQDDFVRMNLSLRNGNKVIKSCPVGEWLTKADYNMSAPILADVSIEYNIVTNIVTISKVQ